MVLNALNQNTTNLKFNLSSFMGSTKGANFAGKNNSSSYYAKKGEPAYQKEMDKDGDGIISFDDLRKFCKEGGISTREMTKMIETSFAYQSVKTSDESASKNLQNTEKTEFKTGVLDLIYAKDGDSKYDKEQDSNRDAIVSYAEYLRYCEQNAKTETKNSDTKVVNNGNKQFMTVSFGHASNIYCKTQTELPSGKIEGKA